MQPSKLSESVSVTRNIGVCYQPSKLLFLYLSNGSFVNPECNIFDLGTCIRQTDRHTRQTHIHTDMHTYIHIHIIHTLKLKGIPPEGDAPLLVQIMAHDDGGLVTHSRPFERVVTHLCREISCLLIIIHTHTHISFYFTVYVLSLILLYIIILPQHVCRLCKLP